MLYPALQERLQDLIARFHKAGVGSIIFADDAESFIKTAMERLQGYAWVRRLLVTVIVVALLSTIIYFVLDLMPRYYTLRISGGDILSNRHQITMFLRKEAEKAGLNLVVQPMSGSLAVLEAVNNGTLDVALVQGGLDVPLPNIRHVTAVLPETVHLLVRSDINAVADLKGRSINLGSKNGGTRVVGLTLLNFSDLESGVDFVETAYSAEELLSLPEHKMPDAVLLISTVPSFVAEELVRVRGYHILEIPFPAALALRFGWVANAKILAYTYKTHPPIPSRDISSLGINLFMICNKNTTDKAIVQMLDILYGVNMRSTLRQTLHPDLITLSSGYPLSVGSERFISRAEPIFSKANIDKIKGVTGLVMSAMTMLMICFSWVTQQRGGAAKLGVDTKALIKDLSMFTSDLTAHMVVEPLTEEMRASFLILCTQLRQSVMERWIKPGNAKPNLQDLTLDSINALERRLTQHPC